MGENTIRYVVGFLFDEPLLNVVLIQKAKPAWQAGKFNGIGGRVELGDRTTPGTPPTTTMVREFQEETGLYVAGDAWTAYAVLGDTKATWEVTFFWAVVPRPVMQQVSTTTEESVQILPISVATSLTANTMANLRWLIPMALTHIKEMDRCQMHQIFELSYRIP